MTDSVARLKAQLAGCYAIGQELGRGGMAVVYRARDLRRGRPVPLKVLNPEIAAAAGHERFLREVAVAARLQHPHILTRCCVQRASRNIPCSLDLTMMVADHGRERTLAEMEALLRQSGFAPGPATLAPSPLGVVEGSAV